MTDRHANAIIRRLEEARKAARYAWQQYQQACHIKNHDEAQKHRESVIWHEAKVSAYLQALNAVTANAQYEHEWDVLGRLGKGRAA